jgi:PPOX class probable F420-dependent enzyme
MDQQDAATARVSRLLDSEPVVWLSTVRPDGLPHLVPIWFSWDGETVLIASKPHARKVANLRANPRVMLALGEPEEDFDVGLLEGVAEILDEPAAAVLPASHLRKYRDQLAAIGLDREEFLATYSLVIRIRPTRFFPWHGRTTPASSNPRWTRADRRLQAAVRRVAASVAASVGADAGASSAAVPTPRLRPAATGGLLTLQRIRCAIGPPGRPQAARFSGAA